MKQSIEIGTIEEPTAGGCCGGGCCGGDSGPAGETAEVLVEGMTCSSCVANVIDELDEVPGVRGVTVSLVPGGQSKVFVQHDGEIDSAAVDAAIAEAGYRTVIS